MPTLPSINRCRGNGPAKRAATAVIVPIDCRHIAECHDPKVSTGAGVFRTPVTRPFLHGRSHTTSRNLLVQQIVAR